MAFCKVLLFSYFVLIILLQKSSNGSNAGNNIANNEAAAIATSHQRITTAHQKRRQELLHRGRESIDRFNNLRNITANVTTGTRLLCVTFASTTAIAHANILANAIILPCDWVIIFYNISNDGI